MILRRTRLLPVLAAGLLSVPLQAAIVITEIHYHPPGNDPNLEFVEIHNDAPVIQNLSGYRIAGGIQFTFPRDTFIEGGAYLVVCANQAAIRSRYGITNTAGDFAGRLDNSSDEIILYTHGGGLECRVDYRDRGSWPAAADGTGHTLSIRGVFLDPDDSASWDRSLEVGGTPGAANFSDQPVVIDTTLIGDAEVWRYLKGTAPFSTPAGAWRAVGFDDSGWLSGQTGIGYGDGDDRTNLADMQNGYLSFAARKSFNLTAAQIAGFDQAVLQVNYDDGFIAFLNGVEIARASMGSPGEEFAHDRPAASHEAGSFDPFGFSKSLLRAGENVLAVQVHNTTIDSSDCSFIPRLISRKVIPPASAGPDLPVRINEVHFRTSGERWLELFNAGSAEADLSGYYLSDAPELLDRHRLADGTRIPAGGFLVVPAAAAGFALDQPLATLYLTRPDLERVIDAAAIESRIAQYPLLGGASEARFPDGSETWVSTPTPTRGAANACLLETNLVLNEIHYNPMAFDPARGPVPGEFLEFTNRGAAPIDLTGFRITKGVDFQFPDGTVLPPGGFLVVAEDPQYIADVYAVAALGPYTGSLSNGGESIRVVDAFGNAIEEVAYFDGGRWSKWADGSGSSLELIDARQDNGFPTAWGASDESLKTQWEEIQYTRSYTQQTESEFQIRMMEEGEILLDGIRVTIGATQYITNGGFESGTGGWRIEGNHIRSGRTIEDAAEGAACLKVVATGAGDTRVNRIETDTATMPSGSASVRIAARWLRGANLVMFSGDNHSMPYVHRLEIPRAQGTPGKPNSIARANQGPVIDRVRQSPPLPGAGEAVRVTARISDADGVAQARIFYRTGSPNGSFQQAALFDDGAHSDGPAGDGLYGGDLPGLGLGTKVVFYIEARDAPGQIGRFPPEAPARTCLYQHTAPAQSPLHVYHAVLDDAAWTELTTRRLHSDELLDGSFIFESSEMYYNIGVRFRGSPWQRPANPRMFRLRFNEDDRFHGMRHANISRYGSRQNERTSYYSIWRNSSPVSTAPHSHTTNIKYFLNGSLHGIMEHIEPINSDYLRFWFPDDPDGNLFKITGRLLFNDNGDHIGTSWASFGYQGTDKERYRWNYNTRTRELEDDFQPLIDLTRTLSSGSTAAIEGILDVEQFFRVLSARVAHDDWDTIGIGNGQNCYIYYAPIERRWKLLPWDVDNTWGNANARTFPDGDTGTSRLLSMPQFRRIHIQLIKGMLDTYWNVQEMSKVLDPVFAVVGQETGSANPSGIKNFISARTPALRGIIPAPVSFRIRSGSGSDFTVTGSSTLIEGDGSIDVAAITVNGETAALTWPASMTIWRTTVNLSCGANPLRFVAYDQFGNIVGSASITVTSTACDAPVLAAVAPGAARPEELVTITGDEFHPGLRVFFGSTRSPRIIFDPQADPRTITAEVAGAAGEVQLTVQNAGGQTSNPLPFTVIPPLPRFIRGDANLDGQMDIGDAVTILIHLFRGAALGCLDAADVEEDEALTVTDAIRVLEYLFRRGPAPPAPFPAPGRDPGGEPLDCERGI